MGNVTKIMKEIENIIAAPHSDSFALVKAKRSCVVKSFSHVVNISNIVESLCTTDTEKQECEQYLAEHTDNYQKYLDLIDTFLMQETQYASYLENQFVCHDDIRPSDSVSQSGRRLHGSHIESTTSSVKLQMQENEKRLRLEGLMRKQQLQQDQLKLQQQLELV